MNRSLVLSLRFLIHSKKMIPKLAALDLDVARLVVILVLLSSSSSSFVGLPLFVLEVLLFQDFGYFVNFHSNLAKVGLILWLWCPHRRQ